MQKLWRHLYALRYGIVAAFAFGIQLGLTISNMRDITILRNQLNEMHANVHKLTVTTNNQVAAQTNGSVQADAR